MAKVKLTKRSRDMFLSGVAEVFQGPKLDNQLKVAPKTGYRPEEDELVYWDMLLDDGFDLVEMREHLKGMANIVTIGRIVGAKALYGKRYMVLKKDNHLRGKSPDYFIYDMSAYVVPWTGEMTQAAFHVDVIRGDPSNVEQPKIQRKLLKDFTPSRWSFTSPIVMTEESIRRARGINPSAWLYCWDYALPKDMDKKVRKLP